MPPNEAVALGASQRVGEHLVRDAIQGVMEVLVAEPPSMQLSEHHQSPASADQPDQGIRPSPLDSHFDGRPAVTPATAASAAWPAASRAFERASARAAPKAAGSGTLTVLTVAWIPSATCSPMALMWWRFTLRPAVSRTPGARRHFSENV